MVDVYAATERYSYSSQSRKKHMEVQYICVYICVHIYLYIGLYIHAYIGGHTKNI